MLNIVYVNMIEINMFKLTELFVREREPKSLEQASKLADQYKEARYVDIVSLTYKNNEWSRSRSNSESRLRSPIRRGHPSQGNQG